jgi:uncharacterized membrane protein
MAKPTKPYKNTITNAVESTPRQARQGVLIQPVTMQTQVYQGPIPPPEVLRGFDDIVPGAAERLIVLAEDESKHRRALEMRSMDANIAAQQRQLSIGEYQSRAVFRSDTVSQALGLIVTLGAIAGAVYLAATGHEAIAALLCAIPTGALIQVFFTKRKPS